MKIHHEHVGSISWMEQHRADFDAIIASAKAGDDRAELLVVNGAAHFYGLLFDDYGTIAALIDAIAGMDQELEFS